MQLAEGYSSVLQNLTQPLKRSLVAMQLRRLLHTSVGESGRSSCIFRGHALAQIFVFQQREMRANFLRQFGFRFGVGEKQIKLQKEASQVLHGYDSSSKSRSTRADILLHPCVSSFKAFCPALVIS